MILSGIYLGISRVTYERFSVKWQRHVILVYVAEIMFWFIQTIIIYFILYQVNYGDIRIYSFLAILLGYSIYVVLIDSMYKRVLEVCIKISRWLNSFIVKIVTFFIIRPVQFVILVIISVFSFIWSLLFIIFKHVLKLKVLLPIKWLRKIKFINKIKGICSTIKNKFKKDNND